APSAAPHMQERRWTFLRRAVSARLALVGATIVLAAIGMAILAPFVSPYDPLKQDLSGLLAAPTAQHWLGTDNVGRDVFSRVIWGARVSLLVGAVSVAMAVVAGGILGLVAGFWGGRIDDVVMRLVDAVLSFPA